MNTINVQLSTLKKAVNQAKGAYDRKSSLEVLRCVLLEPASSTLKLTTTNLEYALRQTIEATCETTGGMAIPLKPLHDALVDFKGKAQLNIQINPATLEATFSIGEHSFTLKGFDELEYPRCFEQKDPQPWIVEGDTRSLIAAADYTLAGAAREDNRPILTGMLLESTVNTLTLTGCDGYRIHTAEWQQSSTPHSAVIPVKSLAHIVRLLNPDVPYDVQYSDNWVRISQPNLETVVSTIYGKYPDYRLIIPRRIEWQATFEIEPMLKALQTVEPAALTSTNTTDLGKWNGGFTVWAKGQDEKVLSAEVPAQMSGLYDPKVTVGVNCEYLTTAVSACQQPRGTEKNQWGFISQQARGLFVNPIAPMMFEPVTLPEKFNHAQIVIMPMALGRC